MQSYHIRRSEKAITEESELLEIIQGQKFMTLALCKDAQPYLVTLNYGFDLKTCCFYFHCAAEGKKIDYLRANPVVWGQVLEDRGYIVGACDQDFRTVQFRGSVTFLGEREAKREALSLMIDHLEPNPSSVKQSQLQADRLDNVTIAKVQVEMMNGKKGRVS
jgi:uncharacterized protein